MTDTIDNDDAASAPAVEVRIDTDTPCGVCDYNLKTLSITGRCPECGTPVLLAIHAERLGYSDPQWLAGLCIGLRRLRWACLLGVGPLIALVVLAFLLSLGTSAEAPGRLGRFAGTLLTIPFVACLTLASVFAVRGVWSLTAKEPQSVRHLRFVRVLIRLLAIAPVSLGLAAFWTDVYELGWHGMVLVAFRVARIVTLLSLVAIVSAS